MSKTLDEAIKENNGDMRNMAIGQNAREQRSRTVTIKNQNGKPLIILEAASGKLTAKYDPANLDEAARLFVLYLMKIFN